MNNFQYYRKSFNFVNSRLSFYFLWLLFPLASLVFDYASGFLFQATGALLNFFSFCMPFVIVELLKDYDLSKDTITKIPNLLKKYALQLIGPFLLLSIVLFVIFLAFTVIYLRLGGISWESFIKNREIFPTMGVLFLFFTGLIAPFTQFVAIIYVFQKPSFIYSVVQSIRLGWKHIRFTWVVLIESLLFQWVTNMLLRQIGNNTLPSLNLITTAISIYFNLVIIVAFVFYYRAQISPAETFRE